MLRKKLRTIKSIRIEKVKGTKKITRTKKT